MVGLENYNFGGIFAYLLKFVIGRNYNNMNYMLLFDF